VGRGKGEGAEERMLVGHEVPGCEHFWRRGVGSGIRAMCVGQPEQA